jgi:hypothetical protein
LNSAAIVVVKNALGLRFCRFKVGAIWVKGANLTAGFICAVKGGGGRKTLYLVGSVHDDDGAFLLDTTKVIPNVASVVVEGKNFHGNLVG